MKRKVFILTAVFVLVAVGGLLLYVNKKSAEPSSLSTPAEIFLPTAQPQQEPAQESADKSFGAQLYEKAQNPIKDEVPPINPFQEVKNPFQGSYKNPFQ